MAVLSCGSQNFTFVGYAPQLEDAILPQVEDFKRAYEEIVKF